MPCDITLRYFQSYVAVMQQLGHVGRVYYNHSEVLSNPKYVQIGFHIKFVDSAGYGTPKMFCLRRFATRPNFGLKKYLYLECFT